MLGEVVNHEQRSLHENCAPEVKQSLWSGRIIDSQGFIVFIYALNLAFSA